MKELTKNQTKQIKKWLTSAFLSSIKFNGSEPSEKDLFTPLSLFEDFVRSQNNEGKPPSEMETAIAEMAFPEVPKGMPLTISGFLDEAAKFYSRLIDTQKSQTTPDIHSILENAGAIVKKSDKIFVKTDEGQLLSAPGAESPKPYKVETEARLAILLAHLRNDGVNGQPIYMDDLVITQGSVDDKMMRQHPYHIIQIPRLNMEIALCEQIGETTFVKKGTVGEEFWDHMSKNELKARENIIAVDHHNDQQWWEDISNFLSRQTQPTNKKVNAQSWSHKKPNLDIDLVKESILAHYRATDGEWLTTDKRGTNGKIFLLEHGPYAKQITIAALGSALQQGNRGLPGGSSVAKLKEKIAKEHSLNYKNKHNQENLDLKLIKESILAHYHATGEWLTSYKKSKNGKLSSYILEHGPYAEQISVAALEQALKEGFRSLPGKSSVAKLKEEIAKEHSLNYKRKHNQGNLDLKLIKESILAHYRATGEQLAKSTKGKNGKLGSFILEHGPYAGQISINSLNQALRLGERSLPGGSSIAELKKELSKKLGLNYSDKIKLENLDIKNIRESILAHYQATGKWFSNYTKSKNGNPGSYILEHGPYAGQINVSTLERSLRNGLRNLPGGSSIAKLKKEIKAELKNVPPPSPEDESAETFTPT